MAGSLVSLRAQKDILMSHASNKSLQVAHIFCGLERETGSPMSMGHPHRVLPGGTYTPCICCFSFLGPREEGAQDLGSSTISCSPIHSDSAAPAAGATPPVPCQLPQTAGWEGAESFARQPAWAQPQLCCSSPSSSALCSTILGATSMPSLPTEQDIWWNGFCGELGKHAVLEWLRAHVICGTENCVYQEKLPKPASFWRKVPGLEGHLQ